MKVQGRTGTSAVVLRWLTLPDVWESAGVILTYRLPFPDRSDTVSYTHLCDRNRRRHVFAADPDDDILQSVWDGLSAPCAVKRLEYAYDQRDLHTVLFFCADPKPTAVQKDDHCGIDADGKGK